MGGAISDDAQSMDRWATFDCYGTLIDWNGGIGRELERLFGVEQAPRLLHGYHEIERELQRERPDAAYRDVLTVALARLAEREGLPLAAEEHDALARSLPQWQAFPEVPAALEDARGRGWKLAILSNTDRDYIEASLASIGVPFELAIVASEIGSYKPAPKHWEAFEAQTGVPRDAHVHVGASLFHDVAPATKLGLRTVWINRLGEEAEPQPDAELHSLTGLGEALDSLG
jgi:2-haloacid dehalogenase